MVDILPWLQKMAVVGLKVFFFKMNDQSLVDLNKKWHVKMNNISKDHIPLLKLGISARGHQIPRLVTYDGLGRNNFFFSQNFERSPCRNI